MKREGVREGQDVLNKQKKIVNGCNAMFAVALSHFLIGNRYMTLKKF